ncbi:MAG: ubiquinone biosynthesis methyltransferase UbiE, partial [Hyphomonadaceae bacterium]
MISEELRLMAYLGRQHLRAPLPVALGRAKYAAAQGARVAWYMAQYALARRLSGPIDAPGAPKFQPARPEGDSARIRAAFLALFAKDRANIEAGLYPAPHDVEPGDAVAALADSARFFADLPKVDARRRARVNAEVRARNENGGRFPAYYLQNFHYQTDGWLSPRSAALYDTQVEILFGGGADAMRRIALGVLMRALKGRDQRRCAHLDLGCGNGRFLQMILEARPKLRVSGLDL